MIYRCIATTQFKRFAVRKWKIQSLKTVWEATVKELQNFKMLVNFKCVCDSVCVHYSKMKHSVNVTKTRQFPENTHFTSTLHSSVDFGLRQTLWSGVSFWGVKIAKHLRLSPEDKDETDPNVNTKLWKRYVLIRR